MMGLEENVLGQEFCLLLMNLSRKTLMDISFHVNISMGEIKNALKLEFEMQVFIVDASVRIVMLN